MLWAHIVQIRIQGQGAEVLSLYQVVIQSVKYASQNVPNDDYPVTDLNDHVNLEQGPVFFYQIVHHYVVVPCILKFEQG